MTENKFEAWGLVELMGHQRVAGRLSEQVIAGANLLRVDIPDGESFRTVYYGPSAIYAVHVTDEAAARGIANNCEKRPAYAWELERQPRLQAPLPPDGGRTHDDDTDDDEIPL